MDSMEVDVRKRFDSPCKTRGLKVHIKQELWSKRLLAPSRYLLALAGRKLLSYRLKPMEVRGNIR